MKRIKRWAQKQWAGPARSVSAHRKSHYVLCFIQIQFVAHFVINRKALIEFIQSLHCRVTTRFYESQRILNRTHCIKKITSYLFINLFTYLLTYLLTYLYTAKVCIAYVQQNNFAVHKRYKLIVMLTPTGIKRGKQVLIELPPYPQKSNSFVLVPRSIIPF